MKPWLAPVAVLLLLYLGFLGFWDWSGQQLPAQVATHFNGGGTADGWMSRSASQHFMLVFAFAFPLFTAALAYAARFLPDSLINLPDRDYWLGPGRRRATMDYLFYHCLWFACLALGFVFGIQFLTVQANRHDPPHLSGAGILVLAALFLAATAAWVGVLLRHFARPGR